MADKQACECSIEYPEHMMVPRVAKIVRCQPCIKREELWPKMVIAMERMYRVICCEWGKPDETTGHEELLARCKEIDDG